jgi:hypothetical protein
VDDGHRNPYVGCRWPCSASREYLKSGGPVKEGVYVFISVLTSNAILSSRSFGSGLVTRVMVACGLKRVEGYCLKCRKTRRVIGARRVRFRNGVLAMRGSCGVCETSVLRIG